MRDELVRRVLVVDDQEAKRLEYVAMAFDRPPSGGGRALQLRTEVAVASGVAEALGALKSARNAERQFHVVVTDLVMDRGTGIDLVRALANFGWFPGDLDVVLVSQDAHAGTYKTEVAALKGEFPDLVVWRKGDRPKHEFRDRLWKSLWDDILRPGTDEVATLPADLPQRWQDGFITQDASLSAELDRLFVRYAPQKISTLIQGEAGVGKRTLAQTIHAFSRPGQPFLRFDPLAHARHDPGWPALSLFGWEKGAFDGAGESRRGWIEEADRGTLFIDDIATLDLNCQVKLLEVLRGGRVERFGSSAGVPVDVRFLFGTKERLEALRSSGRISDAFFYKVGNLRIALPPLHERPGDVAAIGQHIWQRTLRRADPIADEIWYKLASRIWPANAADLFDYLEKLSFEATDPPITEGHVAAVDRLRGGANMEELAELSTFTQRAKHLILAPTLSALAARGEQRTRDDLAMIIAHSHGAYWSDNRHTAARGIYETFPDHAEKCSSCRRHFQAILGYVPKGRPKKDYQPRYG